MHHCVRRPKDAICKPFLVIWEITQACDLACLHCRASAVPEPHPWSLTTEEGQELIRDIADFGRPYPLLVFTGGDPFKRADLPALIRFAKDLGIHVGVSPSATPLLTLESLAMVKGAGASTISLSLDGATAATHDKFRGVAGSYELTLRAAQWALDLGLKLQINTTLGSHNLHQLVEIATLVARYRVMTWSVFLLVPTGRGEQLAALSPEQVEDAMHLLAEMATRLPIKTTEGHHYKRVLAMRQVLEGMELEPCTALSLSELHLRLRQSWRDAVERERIPERAAARRTPMHINSGNGFVFVSHLGHVFPSGFLPISGGNVREQSLVEIYRDSPLFQNLRQPSRLSGRCGACEFKSICGGSRSRAYAVSGDPLGEDPSCAYQPGSFPYPQELEDYLALTT